MSCCQKSIRTKSLRVCERGLNSGRVKPSPRWAQGARDAPNFMPGEVFLA